MPQYLQIIDLAHRGVAAMDLIDMEDPNAVIRIGDMPQLPQD